MLSVFLLFFAWWVQRISGHSVAVCRIVEGVTVTFYAGTYHGASELDSYGGTMGGVLLTKDGVTNRYDFTSRVADVGEFPSAGCDTSPTGNCACSRCPTYTSAGIRWWQKVVVTGFENGVYGVSTTSDTVIEAPWRTGCWPDIVITGIVTEAAAVLFLLDGSRSIRRLNYDAAVAAASGYINTYLTSTTDTGYQIQSNVFTDLTVAGDSFQSDQLTAVSNLQGITYPAGQTNIAQGLQDAIDAVSGQAGYDKYIVLFTDGNSNSQYMDVCADSTYTAQLAANDITVQVVGVGDLAPAALSQISCLGSQDLLAAFNDAAFFGSFFV